MSVLKTLFSAEGRIGRKTYWLANLGLIGVVFVAMFGTYAVNGLPPEDALQTTRLETGILLLATVPYTFVMLQRLNDLAWPRWIAWLCATFSVAYYLTGYLVVDPIQSAMQKPLTPAVSAWLVGLMLLFVLVIVAGCFKGTIGENQHGPDPLAAV